MSIWYDACGKKEWRVQKQAEARAFLFWIGQPPVYEKDGGMIAEYADGRIELVR